MCPESDADNGSTFVFRCVCGRKFPVDNSRGGICPDCERRISPGFIGQDVSVTLSVMLSGDEDYGTGGITEAGGENEQPKLDSLVDQCFGHYRTVRLLGRGGMGAVYQALDESLQRYVALKIIRTSNETLVDTHQLKRLMQEAIAQARVNHPHVVHIYYVGREAGTPFLAMELVPGQTVADRLAEGPLDFAEVVQIAEQVVDALRHTARFDMIHGDIKPSNILLAGPGNAKLSDFGLARRLSQADPQPSKLVGTPNYLSPEVVMGQPVDVRSDMYSLGITLFEMTFGRLPYVLQGGNLLAYVQTHCTAVVRFPEPWPESVPHVWREFLQRLLAKSPDERFQDYDSLLCELRRLRPVALPKAGRIQRGLAWGVDLGLANAAQQFFYGTLPSVASEGSYWDQHRAPYLVLAVLGGLIPAAAAWLQARWRITPGKKLFQLKIVDEHGLIPPRPTLAIRAAAQLLPLCGATVWQVFSALGMRPLGNVVIVLGSLVLAADVACALLHPQGCSLHDLLLKTRVVLGVNGKQPMS